MGKTKYLIVGGGMTGDAAIGGIRELDASGAITVVAAEPHPAYNRPPLTKGLWKGDPESSVWRPTNRTGVEWIAGRRIVSLDLASHRATDDRGTVYEYTKLLLATGCTPRRLPGAPDDVIYYRTLDDYRRTQKAAAEGRSFAVIGGGFIGGEIAAALTMSARKVDLIFPEAGVCARLFPEDLSRSVNELYVSKGVRVHAEASILRIEKTPQGCKLSLKDGSTVSADVAIAGIGVVPNAELATAAGLDVSDGIVVDAQLRTKNPDVYAAGDVVRFQNAALGRSVRVEHEDAALSQGRHAGRGMAGDASPYTHLPFFYSDLFEIGYEAVGNVDSRLTVFADWKTEHREGVLYYLANGRVEGVLLLGMFGLVDKARELIASKAAMAPADLKGRITA
jgi:NADPH-dependent 2,4-dienoyl-CoA reductase/sulfur reductase-like enzyme